MANNTPPFDTFHPNFTYLVLKLTNNTPILEIFNPNSGKIKLLIRMKRTYNHRIWDLPWPTYESYFEVEFHMFQKDNFYLRSRIPT